VGKHRLRVRAKISWHFGASAEWADARRRDAGDVVTSSRSGNAADARSPPRPKGLRPLGLLSLRIFRFQWPASNKMLELRLGPQQNAKLFLREPLAGLSRNRNQGANLTFYRPDELLDGINLPLFKAGFAALPADPCRNSVERNVATPSIRMKRCVASFHFPTAMDALHFFTLTAKSSDHSDESGT